MKSSQKNNTSLYRKAYNKMITIKEHKRKKYKNKDIHIIMDTYYKIRG